MALLSLRSNDRWMVRVRLSVAGGSSKMREYRDDSLVRDHLWLWAHPEGSYNGPQWGLPQDSRITPLEASIWLGIPNIIVVHYGDRPALPLRQFAIPLETAPRIMWSIVGGGGRTDDRLQDAVLDLVQEMPNMVGAFMDDFFHFRGEPTAQWLSDPDAVLPVHIEITLPEPRSASRIELTQSDVPSGTHRSAQFSVAVYSESGDWEEIGKGVLPNSPGARAGVSIKTRPIRSIRITIHGSHDRGSGRCGLQAVRLYEGARSLRLDDAEVMATSFYPHVERSIEERMAIFDGRAGANWADPGLYEARCIVEADPAVPASLAPRALSELRSRLKGAGPHLQLGVAVYDYQLAVPSIIKHLNLVDLVVLWHWQPKDLRSLESNLHRLKRRMSNQKVMIGCYMWDFQAGREIPGDLTEHQCRLGLEWLVEGEIDGMVFLASNLCDMDLPAVNWVRSWIRENGTRQVRSSP